MDILTNIKNNIYSIAIGLRFNPTFAIGDNLGKIADKILYSKKSNFDPNFFPLIDSNINEIILRDKDMSRSLVISTTDIVLQVMKKDGEELNVKLLEEEYKRQIFDSVLKSYQVRDIQRIGYLSKYKIPDKAIAESFCKKCGYNTNNISVRFQKNYPMPEAMQKKEVKDYCTNIYTITKAPNSDELKINSDYQIYFTPFLETHEDVPYGIFLNEKNRFNEEVLPETLGKYLST